MKRIYLDKREEETLRKVLTAHRDRAKLAVDEATKSLYRRIAERRVRKYQRILDKLEGGIACGTRD